MFVIIIVHFFRTGRHHEGTENDWFILIVAVHFLLVIIIVIRDLLVVLLLFFLLLLRSRRSGNKRNLFLELINRQNSTSTMMTILVDVVIVIDDVDVVIVVIHFQRALKRERHFARNGRAMEELQGRLVQEGDVVVEGGLDVLLRVRVGERDEANLARLGVDGGVRAFVEALDKVVNVLERRDINPGASLAAAGTRVGVGLDVEKIAAGREVVGAEDLEHFGDELDVAFLGELAHEDTQGRRVAGAAAGGALVAESVGVGGRAAGALPRDLAAGRVVVVGQDGLDGFEDRDEGRAGDFLGEVDVRGGGQRVGGGVVVVVRARDGRCGGAP